MYNKFKNKDIVIVNGFGKNELREYKNKVAQIICRDPFFLDYNIRFEDNTEDWIDGDCLTKLGGK